MRRGTSWTRVLMTTNAPVGSWRTSWVAASHPSRSRVDRAMGVPSANVAHPSPSSPTAPAAAWTYRCTDPDPLCDPRASQARSTRAPARRAWSGSPPGGRGAAPTRLPPAASRWWRAGRRRRRRGAGRTTRASPHPERPTPAPTGPGAPPPPAPAPPGSAWRPGRRAARGPDLDPPPPTTHRSQRWPARRAGRAGRTTARPLRRRRRSPAGPAAQRRRWRRRDPSDDGRRRGSHPGSGVAAPVDDPRLSLLEHGQHRQPLRHDRPLRPTQLGERRRQLLRRKGPVPVHQRHQHFPRSTLRIERVFPTTNSTSQRG